MPPRFNPTHNPLASVEDVDRATYGDLPEALDEVVLARRVPIDRIMPDLKQPRRAIPAEARGEWDGDPAGVLTALGNWHALVEERIGDLLDLSAYLRATADDVRDQTHESDEPTVATYFDLLGLAQSIYAEGLRQAVEVYRHGGMYKIQFGERRWLAHHLLSTHVSGDFATIPAVVVSAPNVWAQAAENGAHKPLNAIGMARQLALLIMHMYERDPGVSFDAYEALALPGECDRKYYAQVARGELYRIKSGMLERVLSVTGLPSKDMVSRYRALLEIDDGLWVKADSQNWTEGAIRDYAATARKLQAIADGEANAFARAREEEARRLTIVNLPDGESPGQTSLHGVENNPATPSPAIPATTLPSAEYQMLDRAWLVMKNGESKIKGWFLGYPAQRLVCDRLIMRKLLEQQYRPMNGTNPAGTYYRITKAGCQALTRVYIDHDHPGAPTSVPAMTVMPAAEPVPAPTPPAAPSATPLYGDQVVTVKVPFPYGSVVMNTRHQHIGKVFSSGVASRRNDDGTTTEIEYVTVHLLRGAQTRDGLSWQVSDVRLATDDEVEAYQKAYQANPTTPPPAQTIDEDEDDEESAEEPQTPDERAGARGAADAALAAAAVGDAAAPLLESWAGEAGAGEFDSVLKLLHRLAPTTSAERLRTQELLTMSRADMTRLVEKSGGTSYWKGYLTDAEAGITQLVGEQILAPLHRYIVHLRAVGAAIERERD